MANEVFGLDGISSTLQHCGVDYKLRSSGTRWAGEFEINTARLYCPVCGSLLTIEVTTQIGFPPERAE